MEQCPQCQPRDRPSTKQYPDTLTGKLNEESYSGDFTPLLTLTAGERLTCQRYAAGIAPGRRRATVSSRRPNGGSFFVLNMKKIAIARTCMEMPARASGGPILGFLSRETRLGQVPFARPELTGIGLPHSRALEAGRAD